MQVSIKNNKGIVGEVVEGQSRNTCYESQAIKAGKTNVFYSKVTLNTAYLIAATGTPCANMFSPK